MNTYPLVSLLLALAALCAVGLVMLVVGAKRMNVIGDDGFEKFDKERQR